MLGTSMVLFHVVPLQSFGHIAQQAEFAFSAVTHDLCAVHLFICAAAVHLFC
jgi:hypothetical protein